MNEYIGAIHIHSNYSDGSGSVWDIAVEARQAEADFVIISDHNSAEPSMDGWGGYHAGVLVLAAVEIGVNDSEHILVLGSSEIEGLLERTMAEKIDLIKSRGGFAFVAHPRAARTSWYKFGADDWRSWDLATFSGIEIWSLMHDVCNGMLPRDVLGLRKNLVSRSKGPYPEVVEQWDRLTQSRQVPAIGSLDSHARPLPLLGRNILDYRDACGALRTHIFSEPLTGEADADTGRVIDALLAGRCFVALDVLADASGFSFIALAGDEEILMGEEVSFAGPTPVRVQSPREAELRLVKDGQILASVQGTALERTADEPGVYRVEAHIAGKPWVFTNPIYLRP